MPKANLRTAQKVKTLSNLVGPKVRALREQLYLLQNDLAIKMEAAGIEIDRTMIAKIENQTRGVSDKELVALSRALRSSPHELLEFED